MSIYDDDNPSYERLDVEVDEQWEPWEPDDELVNEPGGCHYCGGYPIREYPDPFGQQPCCDTCFNLLITDEDQ